MFVTANKKKAHQMCNQPLFVLLVFLESRYMCGNKKVREKAKIRNRYNQAPHLTQNTLGERDKSVRTRHIQMRLEVSPFKASDHKAARPDADKAIQVCQRRTQIKTRHQSMVHHRKYPL